MSNIKLLMGIVVLSLCQLPHFMLMYPADTPASVHRKAAVVALAALIYYVFATELTGMLKPKEKDPDDEPPARRKKVPIVSIAKICHPAPVEC